ncbi:MAG: response regulator [Thermoanaerobaculia bacterium]
MPDSLRKVLICEDDETIRLMMTRALQRAGYEVESVPNGREAIAKLDSDRFDLIVLDLMMPDVDGFEVAQYLSENAPRRLKRVVVTTALPPSMMERLPAGICTILPKPFDIQDFLSHAHDCSDDTLTRGRKPEAQA